MGQHYFFSDNVIFVDTEFSSLDPYKGEILSIGLVKKDGESLYLELEHEGEADDWVKRNILPKLKGKKIPRKKAADEIRKFIGKEKPYAVAFVNQFDMVYLHKLFGKGNTPFYWLPVDFASILFSRGIDPENFLNPGENGFFEKLGIDWKKFEKHNALDDAKLLRESYLKLRKTNE